MHQFVLQHYKNNTEGNLFLQKNCVSVYVFSRHKKLFLIYPEAPIQSVLDFGTDIFEPGRPLESTWLRLITEYLHFGDKTV